jgi:hypothetical protein
MPTASLERLLSGFYYVEVRTRWIPGRGREWVVGLQAERGSKVLRVADPDLNAALREAVRMAGTCGAREKPFRARPRSIESL